ncbi:MAG: hypothetical protein ACRD1Y_03755 [Terriglobales bacterium]
MKGKPFGKIWIAVAVILFVLEGVGHWLLRSTLATSAIMPWRTSLHAITWGLFVAVAIVGGLAYTYIFLQGYRGKGIGEGIRFGLWVTLLASVTFNVAAAAMLPVRIVPTVEFIVVDLVSFVVAGIAAAALAGSGAQTRQSSSASMAA